MTKKFLTSVADAYGYNDSTGALLFVGKTLLDSSIETSLGNSDVRGGRGNQLQYVYYHTAEMNITISDAQWNLDFLAVGVGASVATGNNVYAEETITLVASAGTVAGTPLAVTGSTLYGWVTHLDGSVEKVTFTGSAFTCASGGATDTVCVRYYASNAASRSVTIAANIIPSQVRLVLEAQLNSSDEVANKIGVVQIHVPKATLTGAFSISMTPDGVSTTPLAARALASPDLSTAACTSVPVLAKIIEIIDSANWYDDVVGLSIAGGDFALTHPTSSVLSVWAVPSTGAAFKPPVADLDFTSGTVGTATIGLHTGIVTTVAAGTTLLTVAISAAPTVETSATLTVS